MQIQNPPVPTLQKIINGYYQLSRLKAEPDGLAAKQLSLTLRDFHAQLATHGVKISFRALSGRVEKGNIVSFKIEGCRRIPQYILDKWVYVMEKCVTLEDTYRIYSRFEPHLNERAFRKRFEDRSFFSVKLFDRRYVPKYLLEEMIRVRVEYCTLAEAYHEYCSCIPGLKFRAFIKRFEDGSIKAEKIFGRRMVSREYLREYIESYLKKKGQVQS